MTDEVPVRSILTQADDLCREAGLRTRWEQNSWDKSSRLEVGVQNGRYTRWRHIAEHEARIIIADGVPPVTCLGDYEAVLHTDTLELEAGIGDSTPAQRNIAFSLSAIPGVVVEDEGIPEHNREYGNWVFSLNSTHQQWSAEVGKASRRFVVFGPDFFRRGVTLKIRGIVKSDKHDEAVAMLEEVGQAILFEIDLRYNISANISPISWRTRTTRVDSRGDRSPVRRIPVEVSKDCPTLPRSVYPPKPLALYRYARSAINMPLLQYLAFYQVIEYYFASYFHREILNRMKQELLDPRFSPQNEVHLNRLISLATSHGKGSVPEKEQLRAAVRACVSAPLLEEYLTEPRRNEFFTGKQQPIKGIPRIDLNGSADPRDQVSDRIYDIRCRIVHSKSELTEYPDLILPFSKEADALDFDIDLVRYLAQRVLVSRAEPLRVL